MLCVAFCKKNIKKLLTMTVFNFHCGMEQKKQKHSISLLLGVEQKKQHSFAAVRPAFLD